MALQFSFQKYVLNFNFKAITSRGAITARPVWFIFAKEGNKTGIGEAAPLEGLSPERPDEFEKKLDNILKELNGMAIQEWQRIIFEPVLNQFPAVKFALEMAFYDLLRDGNRKYFSNDFVKGEMQIPINGLIWMADQAVMEERAEEKLNQGYTTLKFKVGSIDFEKEKAILQTIRSKYHKDQVAIRLDANGAFTSDEALKKLNELAVFDIHSVEQPIQPGQADKMAELCRESPVSIALDEELIEFSNYEQKQQLIEKIKPQYLVLKPTLLGGFNACLDWIDIARSKNAGWWLTSSLESNIGLTALAQFTASFDNLLPQGLGTGRLFTNNIPSPLLLEKGYLSYDPDKKWDLSALNFS